MDFRKPDVSSPSRKGAAMSALVAAASVAVRTAVAEAVRRTEKFDIVTAPSPEAALKIAASRHFDLSVLEVKS